VSETPEGPSPDVLLAAAAEFAPNGVADRSWGALMSATGGLVDPALAEHRRALLVWLNAWGCRIRYPRDGEPDLFGDELARWWSEWGGKLPDVGTAMADLSDEAVVMLGEGFAVLMVMPTAVAARPGGRPRTLGSTAAAKLLYALRPESVMPWDEMIAMRLHGARDGAAYAAHQKLGRSWSRRILAEAPDPGVPGRSLARLLDEYCYLVYTRGWRP
jgi:hypothetical protein